jgi:hypothetical protein
MIAETIFYVTGSIFFTLAISTLAMFVYYTFRILQKIVDIETEMKNAVTEVKVKIATFSVGLAGLVALLEKILEIKNKHGKKNEETSPESEKDGGEEPPAKKIRIKRIFARGG